MLERLLAVEIKTHGRGGSSRVIRMAITATTSEPEKEREFGV